MSANDLKQKVILVSGVGGGIGTEVANCLAEAGALLSVCDLPQTGTGRWADVAAGSHEVLATLGDLSRRDEAARWVAGSVAEFGHIDGLVNVAGWWRTRGFLDIEPDELDGMWRSNVSTAFWPCQAVAGHLMAQGRGSIVNFASTAGQYGSIAPGSHYAAAKGAVIGLTKSLARELAPYGVRVNAISPGPVRTVALSGGADLDLEKAARRTLLGRLGSPRDIAQAVLYLVADGSSWVTGQIMGVNGGSLL
ncbi:MAG: SDR family NAD(P)-dependent oxidoreductase [Acidimicrobiales bacterium]